MRDTHYTICVLCEREVAGRDAAELGLDKHIALELGGLDFARNSVADEHGISVERGLSLFRLGHLAVIVEPIEDSALVGAQSDVGKFFAFSDQLDLHKAAN